MAQSPIVGDGTMTFQTKEQTKDENLMYLSNE